MKTKLQEEILKIVRSLNYSIVQKVAMIEKMFLINASQPQSQPKGETVIAKLKEAFLDKNLECDGAGCMGCWKDIVREAIKMLEELPPSNAGEVPSEDQIEAVLKLHLGKQSANPTRLFNDQYRNLFAQRRELVGSIASLLRSPSHSIEPRQEVKSGWEDDHTIKQLHLESAELSSLKTTIFQSPLKKYFPEREMSFHDKVLFAIHDVIAKADSPPNKEEIVKWLDGEIDTNPDEIGRSMNSTIRRVKRFILSLPTPEKESKKD